MYEAVHAYPDGDATVSRHARTAARHGYDGIVVRTRDALPGIGEAGEGDRYDAGDDGRREADSGDDGRREGDSGGADADEPRGGDAVAIRERYGVDVVDAVEIDADDPGSAGGAVGNYRPDRTVVCVVGGDDRLNRFAVEEPRVDVLVRPTRGGGGFNHVLAKAARDNGVHVEFDFGPVLRATGGQRVRSLAALRKLREIVTYYDAPHVVSANAGSHLELRAPREVVAVGEAAGFDPEWVREGLRAWGGIAERNRERLSEGFIEPGVRRGRYETQR
ncbi:ribonuclease P [Halorubrum sp. JWXQ-INN 858]|uniref:RNase P subunit p30 family protein n=1 Tax=Halorubrum sp. JWXQ-INN 858 TaxID=2690782 RepID=UPI00135BB0CF|nr:RNase P subunit p30 family protein [Halorubrum sp. JWXQ-INN 858]MWV65280.1 ribonuclease P [Halorubrum sp. JWXQ-INN 858]